MNNFKCPNEKENKTICNIGYACDGCPYNEEIKPMKFKIVWLEIINQESVANRLGIDNFDEDNPKQYKQVLNKILSNLPIGSKRQQL